jgi:hypothetical protein
LQKAVSKRIPKSYTVQLSLNEPWETFKAQILAKVSAALDPPQLDITHYEIMCTIPRVITKPGMPVLSEADYTTVTTRARNASTKEPPIISITVSQHKENAPVAEAEAEKAGLGTKKKQRDPATLPGNLKRAANVKLLEERWKCPKQQPNCVGKYCYIDLEHIHIPLSHERLDVWASAMVRSISYICNYTT